jgi:hypothetical protein
MSDRPRRAILVPGRTPPAPAQPTPPGLDCPCCAGSGRIAAHALYHLTGRVDGGDITIRPRLAEPLATAWGPFGFDAITARPVAEVALSVDGAEQAIRTLGNGPSPGRPGDLVHVVIVPRGVVR